jgi:RNA polymerase sigma factor (sigma-70 family)
MQIEEKQMNLDHLFRTEAQKMIAVLTKIYGFHRIDEVEDIVQETFITAYETWKIKGFPDHPNKWLYTVAKNKIINQLKREKRYETIVESNSSIIPLEYSIISNLEQSKNTLLDTQVQMIFSICHPSIPKESQIALALKSLCAFSIQEIADAFLTKKETINKRLYRAKEKIKDERINLEFPDASQIISRLSAVLKIIYLLFNEGYYSKTNESILRKDLCLEAMRICLLIIDFPLTNKPSVNALMALMCYHSSRFDSRVSESGSLISLEDQNKNLWSKELISQGNLYLSKSISNEEMGEYHLQAMIAWNHTEEDSPKKWQRLLVLYDKLLAIQFNPIVLLNRAYVLGKCGSEEYAIQSLLQYFQDKNNHYYHLTLTNLYMNKDKKISKEYLMKAIDNCKSTAEKNFIQQKFSKILTEV